MPEKHFLKKIDPRGRSLMEKQSLPSGSEVLLRLEGPLSADQDRELCDAGWTGRSSLGSVASGVVENAAGLEAIARLDFVRQIQVSAPMFDEAGDGLENRPEDSLEDSPEDRREEP
jgi:hypothetical protein